MNGDCFRQFVMDMVMTRGTMKLPDQHRLNDRLEANTAPLSEMAIKCSAAGFPLHKSTMRLLFEPPRKNDVSSGMRGFIPAKRGSIILSESLWGARCTFSASNMRNIDAFLYETRSRRIADVCAYHCDEMSKQPIWTARRSRARIGYMLADENGKYVIKNADHTFPLTHNFLISVGGVVKCLQDPVKEDGSFVSLAYRPSEMNAFLRNCRYSKGGMHCVMNDFMSTVYMDDQAMKASILFEGSDNGGSTK